MQYQVSLSYGKHSGYIGDGGPSLDSAQAHCAEMIGYYAGLGYVIHTSTISTFCLLCTQGKVRQCKSPKRHANGYHADTCYKTCFACNGKFETIHHQTRNES